MSISNKLFIQMSAQSIDAVIINYDLIKSFYLDNDISMDKSPRLAYHLGFAMAEDIIKQGRNILFDSMCQYNYVLETGMALAEKYGLDYRYIECRVEDIDLLDQRLKHRASLRSQPTGVNCPPPDLANADDFGTRFKTWIENPLRPLTINTIVVDSTASPEKCNDYILQHLRSPSIAQKDRTEHINHDVKLDPGSTGARNGEAINNGGSTVAEIVS
ncbi:hypothetical protein BT63DRAFT_436899 [Microthyrium microscopicum]|uniref:P-loop containing nucleoside triphosphate hydrolase protein n=1 Tax=Microthyrium microscopicum TaxID=703497 RepID=A0A6A6UPV0_9PEZI|nr:hypothetical protein BT63DRAFT_436899 [Microthyrium microscopicum]